MKKTPLINETIPASDYKLIIETMFSKTTKTEICATLNISRPTHDLWLENGVNNTQQVRRIRRIVERHVDSLRRRARTLDKWTTKHEIYRPLPRLTYQPLSTICSQISGASN